jgi:hypothetical protein
MYAMTARRLHELLTQVQDLLTQVQAELTTVDELDDAGRAHVLKTMGDLAQLLERTSGRRQESEEVDEDSLGERLEEAARNFEAEHPQLVAALQQIADTLRGAGI